LGSFESRLLPKAGTPAECEDVGFTDCGINRLDQSGRSAYPPWIPFESAMYEHNTGRRLATFLDWRQTDHPCLPAITGGRFTMTTDQTELGYHVEVRAQDNQLFRSGAPSVKDPFGPLAACVHCRNRVPAPRHSTFPTRRKEFKDRIMAATDEFDHQS
jgi:hypothetical protein